MDKQNEVVSVLEKLIETCRDGQKGYQAAAEHAKGADLKSYFEKESSERGKFAGELQAVLTTLGTGKKETGSVSAALHRAWIDTKANLGAGDKAILDSVEQGEDSAKKNYEEALSSKKLDANLEAIVQRQADSVRSAHDKVKSMRDQRAA